MKNLILIFIPLLLFIVSCEDEDENGQNCDNSSWISFDFEGTTFWDSDIGAFVSLDNIDIIVCDIDYQIGAICNNVFNDDLDQNPDGSVDFALDFQYHCHPEAPGFYNGGYISSQYRLRDIGSFVNTINEPISIADISPGTFGMHGPLFVLGNGCTYQTSSGTYTFTEINMNSNTFRGSFSFDLSPHNLQYTLSPEDCLPGLDNISVSGSFEFINVEY